MTVIVTEILIDKTPTEVQETFMKFDTFKDWSKALVKIDANGKDPKTLVAGDKLRVRLEPEGASPMNFSPVVVENTSGVFSWKGTLLADFVFRGTHKFEFVPVDGGKKTKLIQSEEFGGFLNPVIDYFTYDSTKKAFATFNESLKVKSEQ
ncbi:unnamed protein product [[Candida] boidinii]|nr:unnamed protein product [[Candida] boidinii]